MRRPNLTRVLIALGAFGTRANANSPHPSSREGHLSTLRRNSVLHLFLRTNAVMRRRPIFPIPPTRRSAATCSARSSRCRCRSLLTIFRAKPANAIRPLLETRRVALVAFSQASRLNAMSASTIRSSETAIPLSVKFSGRSSVGRIVGAKPALKPRQVWAIRFWLDHKRQRRIAQCSISLLITSCVAATS